MFALQEYARRVRPARCGSLLTKMTSLRPVTPRALLCTVVAHAKAGLITEAEVRLHLLLDLLCGSRCCCCRCLRRVVFGDGPAPVLRCAGVVPRGAGVVGFQLCPRQAANWSVAFETLLGVLGCWLAVSRACLWLLCGT